MIQKILPVARNVKCEISDVNHMGHFDSNAYDFLEKAQSQFQFNLTQAQIFVRLGKYRGLILKFDMWPE